MRTETFFEKFDLLAEAPGAVGKMRELVLELAVQGRLVRQDGRERLASRWPAAAPSSSAAHAASVWRWPNCWERRAPAWW